MLATLGDADEIDSVLESLESEDLATQVVMLRYLRQVARGNDEAKQRLTRMLGDPQSPLFQNEQAVQVLRGLKSGPEKPNEQKPASAPEKDSP